MTRPDDVLLTFAHVSDTHLDSDPTYNAWGAPYPPWLSAQALVQTLTELPFDIDFVLHTGDVVDHGDQLEAYRAAQNLFAQLRPKVYFLRGNHDQNDHLQLGMLNSAAPTDQHRFSFEVNGVEVIALDSNIDPKIKDGGRLGPEQLEWLAERLRQPDPRPLIVALHHNTFKLGAPWIDKWVLEDGEELHKTLLLGRDRLRVVLSGHIHEPTDTMRDGLWYATSTSTWGQTRTWHGQVEPYREPVTTPGFNIVTVTKTNTFVRRYRFDLPWD